MLKIRIHSVQSMAIQPAISIHNFEQASAYWIYQLNDNITTEIKNQFLRQGSYRLPYL